MENKDRTFKEFKNLALSKKRKKIIKIGTNIPVITTSELIPKKIIMQMCLIFNIFLYKIKYTR